MKQNYNIPIEVSARHIHLNQNDADILFGKNYIFKKLANLSQPNQFSTLETIDLIGPKNSIKNVRLIIPFRNKTQLEITLTDSYFLGINLPPINISGDLDNSAGGLIIKGPNDEIKLEKGIIVAKRHLHIESKIAKKFNIFSGDLISIKCQGLRAVIFEKVVVRSSLDKDKLSFQVDTDEANAANIKNGDFGIISNKL